MSKSSSALRVALALMALVPAFVPVEAQRATTASAPPSEMPELRTRILAAERAYRVANGAYRSMLEADRIAAAPLDSLRAGGLRIEASTALSSFTKRALQRAADASWGSAALALGDSVVAATRGDPLLFRQDSARSLLSPAVAHIWLARAPSRGSAMRVPLSSNEATDAMLDRIGALAAGRVSLAFSEWTFSWIPPRRFAGSDWAEVAVMMATANSSATRGCFAGAAARCLAALDLTPVNDRYSEWYSPEDWQVIVRAHFTGATEPWPNARRECLNLHNDKACLAIIKERPAPQPMPIDVRHSVVAYALERGGPKAFARLIEARGTPLEALVAASGLSTDSLIDGWRSRVVSNTPHTVRPHALEATLMLGWALVFGIAAGRRRP